MAPSTDHSYSAGRRATTRFSAETRAALRLGGLWVLGSAVMLRASDSPPADRPAIAETRAGWAREVAVPLLAGSLIAAGYVTTLLWTVAQVDPGRASDIYVAPRHHPPPRLARVQPGTGGCAEVVIRTAATHRTEAP